MRAILCAIWFGKDRRERLNKKIIIMLLKFSNGKKGTSNSCVFDALTERSVIHSSARNKRGFAKKAEDNGRCKLYFFIFLSYGSSA